MSLWDFVGGAADAVLDKRKRDMASQLQKDLEEQRRNFQMALEEKRDNREFDRNNIVAESQRLERDDRRAESAAERAAREAERKENARLREEELKFRQSDSAANRAATAAERAAAAEDRGLARRIQLASAGLRLTEGGDLERDPNFTAPASQYKPSDIIQLSKAISEVSDPTVRQAAKNALDVGDYTGAASILAGRQKSTTSSPSLSPTDFARFVPPPSEKE